MPNYTYAQLTIPNSDCIGTSILSSAMTDKDFTAINWSEATTTLTIIFTNTLSAGDVTILNGIVVACDAIDQEESIQGSQYWQDAAISILSTPPVTPIAGDRYIIGSGATGVWATHDDKVAEWDGTQWVFLTPNKGSQIWNIATGRTLAYNDNYPTGSWANIETTLDHGTLAGLGDDDHTQYILVNGTRAFTGVVGGITPTLPAHLTTKSYVDGAFATTTHKNTHVIGGSDAFISTDHIDAIVRRVRETSGPTTLDFGAIATGQVLTRSGSTVVGVASTTLAASVSVQEEGTPITGTPHTTLNFVGANVTAADAGGGVATITVSAGSVPTSRTLTAGAGLTGGGDLSADRTFNVVANGDGSIIVNADDIQVGVLATDAQHGTRGGGTLHTVATTLAAGFMSATDKTKMDTLITIREEGSPITGTPHTILNFIGSGVTATNAGGGVASITIPGTSVSSILPAVQARRSTSLAIPLSFTDVTFDVTDIETDSAVVDHDSINTDRIIVKETGTYLICYNATVDDEVEFRVRINDTTVISGGSARCGEPTDTIDQLLADVYNVISNQFIANLTANDFLSIQVQSLSSSETIAANATFVVIKLQGVKGDTGSGSSITIEDEGSTVTGGPHSTLDFVGGGVTVTNSGGGQATVTIPGDGVFGQNFEEASSLAIATTTSTSFQTKLTHTTASVPAGKYRVGWQFLWSASDVTLDIEYEVRIDGTQVMLAEMEPQDPDSDQFWPASGFHYITFGSPATHTLDIRYRSEGGVVTARISDAKLEFWRVS